MSFPADPPPPIQPSPGDAAGPRPTLPGAGPIDPVPGADPETLFGAALEPVLIAACEGRLGELRWFRTDWQRGGALTGYATYQTQEGGAAAVVVKLPVPPQELSWLDRLQAERHSAGQVAPRLYAGGRTLGGYDLCWVVMERLRYGPLDASWGGSEVGLLVEAAGRFYAAAAGYPVDRPPRPEDWDDVMARSRRAVRDLGLGDAQRWNTALKQMQKRWKKQRPIWEQRDTNQWCHGDLHLGNAMTRRPPPGGPALLFDLARVHAGHWVEDAMYLEHLFWSSPGRLGGADVAKLIHRRRKALGLAAGADWPRLANLRRALLAAAAPAEQASRPNPLHLRAALVKLEQLLGAL